MDNKLYDYSPIVGRPKLAWPNGARLAFYIGLNIEHFEVDHPEHFKPKVASGRFAHGDKIGPYTPKTKNTKVSFKYSPDTATLAADSHTILIGN